MVIPQSRKGAGEIVSKKKKLRIYRQEYEGRKTESEMETEKRQEKKRT